METVQLDQHAKEMENRLEELRQRMNQEKEEREAIWCDGISIAIEWKEIESSQLQQLRSRCTAMPISSYRLPLIKAELLLRVPRWEWLMLSSSMLNLLAVYCSKGRGLKGHRKMGASHWRSAQPGVQSVRTNKENSPHRLSPGKMKIRVLKDEPVPAVQKQVIAEPAAKVYGTNRKLNLRGKVCGQCEVQLAGLMCAECGEDYCVGCFVRFHQKGALKRHHMVPVQVRRCSDNLHPSHTNTHTPTRAHSSARRKPPDSVFLLRKRRTLVTISGQSAHSNPTLITHTCSQAELQTPVSTRDVLGRLQQQVSCEESQHAQGASHKSADETEATEKGSAAGNLQLMSDNKIQHTQVLFVNDGVDVEDEEAGEEEDSSLLRGGFDEEESARSFQEALKEWRERGQRPVSVMETQTEKGSQQIIYVEFKEDTLSYMEKLLLKKHRRITEQEAGFFQRVRVCVWVLWEEGRRVAQGCSSHSGGMEGQIEEFQPQSVVQSQPEPPTPPPAEMDELSRKLTAERMELHKYFTSLFTTAPAEDAGKADSPAESYLSIVELDEVMVGDATMCRSFGVEKGNESEMFIAVGNEDLSEGGDFGYSLSPSTPSFSEMTKETFGECNSDIKINSSPETWLPSREAEQSSSSSRSKSLSALQTRLQRSQHLSTTSESLLSNSRTADQKVDSPKPSSRMRSSAAQQDKSSEILPTSSLPKTKLNQTLPGFEDHISTFSPSPRRKPSVRSSQCHSPAFPISKASPKPPDSLSPRCRSVSSPVNRIQSRPAHSTPVSKLKLAQLSPVRAIASPVSSLQPSLRESSQSGLVSDRRTPIYDSNRSSTPKIESFHTEGHRSPPPSKWLKSSRRSPKTTVLSLQLSMSDSEEETTGEDSCLVPSEEDSSDEELRRITDAGEERNGFASPCPTMTPPADPHFTFTKSEHDNTESDLFTGSSKRQGIQLGQYQDLEGILTLGLDPGVLQPNPAPAQTSREENHTGNSLGQESWRSFSSLQHHAEEELVAALMNGRPVSSTPRPFTPGRSRIRVALTLGRGVIYWLAPVIKAELIPELSAPAHAAERLLCVAACGSAGNTANGALLNLSAQLRSAQLASSVYQSCFLYLSTRLPPCLSAHHLQVCRGGKNNLFNSMTAVISAGANQSLRYPAILSCLLFCFFLSPVFSLCISYTCVRCSPITSRPLSAGTSRPDPTSQPLSRAAQEIMEVQTVEQLDLQDSDEDEEDFLALACLEEEFRNMSTTPLDEGEDGHIPVD
ncbi:Zinc finger B-box domain-containing protein 1 [Labeo rohita]|uniref:Zinc finger B-box domain-containing protein 1 n=2 Tax=Labeonini TaxID=2743697 RepID=A0ABQ8LTV4_LABRO|nr:Zinc finger B-box domain-containing protein 1 [Labeo rohita]